MQIQVWASIHLGYVALLSTIPDIWFKEFLRYNTHIKVFLLKKNTKPFLQGPCCKESSSVKPRLIFQCIMLFDACVVLPPTGDHLTVPGWSTAIKTSWWLKNEKYNKVLLGPALIIFFSLLERLWFNFSLYNKTCDLLTSTYALTVCEWRVGYWMLTIGGLVED